MHDPPRSIEIPPRLISYDARSGARYRLHIWQCGQGLRGTAAAECSRAFASGSSWPACRYGAPRRNADNCIPMGGYGYTGGVISMPVQPEQYRTRQRI